MSQKQSRSGTIYLAIMLAFLYAPIALLIFYSFNAGKTMAKWGGFSLKWYIELFHDKTIMNALSVTLSIAVLSALIAVVIGTLAAIGIASMGRKPRAAVLAITNLPVINPDLVTGLSLMLLFVSAISIINRIVPFFDASLGYGTLLIAHITFNIPYVILSVMPKLRQSSDMLYEAALDLGASPMQALVRVIIPDIMPGIVTGATLAFTLSLDDFVVSFFTRQGVQNLSIVIYSMARRGIKPEINALSAIMFVVILALLLLINLRGVYEDKKNAKNTLRSKSTQRSVRI